MHVAKGQRTKPGLGQCQVWLRSTSGRRQVDVRSTSGRCQVDVRSTSGRCQVDARDRRARPAYSRATDARDRPTRARPTAGRTDTRTHRHTHGHELRWSEIIASRYGNIIVMSLSCHPHVIRIVIRCVLQFHSTTTNNT